MADKALVFAAADADHQRVRRLRIEQRNIDVGVIERIVDRIGGVLQQRVQVRARRAYRGYARDQGEARGAALFLAVALGVVYRHRGVAREQRQQLLRFGVQRVRCVLADAEHADQAPARADRHADVVHAGRRAAAGIGKVVVIPAPGLAQFQHAPGQALAARHFRAQFARGNIVAGGGADHVALGHVQADHAVVGADQIARALDDARQQRFQREFARYLLNHLGEKF